MDNITQNTVIERIGMKACMDGSRVVQGQNMIKLLVVSLKYCKMSFT